MKINYKHHITKDGVVKRNPVKSIDLYKTGFAREYASLFGFNPDKTLIHGTSLSVALEIKRTGLLLDGTFLPSNLGSFKDASMWAYNKYSTIIDGVNYYNKNGVVIMVEVEEDLNRPSWSTWITLGKRGKEREGMDKIMNYLTIKKMIIFNVPDLNKGEHILKVRTMR